MSAPFLAPFNFNPVSVSILSTGSYTVPASRYAFISIINFSNGTNFTINGTAISFIIDGNPCINLTAGNIISVSNNTRLVIQLFNGVV